ESECVPFKAHAGWASFFRHALHHGNRLAGTGAGRRITGDFGCRKHIIADDSIRAGDVTDRDERAKGDHLACGIAGLEFQNVAGFETEWGVSLSGDLVSASEEIEIIDVERTEIDLESIEDFTQGNAHGFG